MKEKRFKTEKDMIEMLIRMDETDIRSVNYIDEAYLTLITDVCPVFDAMAVVKAFGLSEKDEAAVEETIHTTGCIWTGPVTGTVRAVPVAETAISSLCGRAGLYGPAVRMKPTILNEGFVLHSRSEENKAKTLIRGGQLIASHSNKYQWLPQGELMQTNQAVFTDLFGAYEFDMGIYTDEITCVLYKFPNQAASLTAKYNRIMQQSGLESVIPAVLFSTSDVTKSGANLYPMMVRADGNRIRLGNSIKLSHDNSHTVTDYADNCYQVLSLLQDSTKQIEKLSELRLLYPENAFRNIVRKFGLPVGAANRAFEDFTVQRGGTVTANDLYWSVWNTAGYLSAATPSRILEVEEQLSRLIFADWKKLDTPMCD